MAHVSYNIVEGAVVYCVVPDGTELQGWYDNPYPLLGKLRKPDGYEMAVMPLTTALAFSAVPPKPEVKSDPPPESENKSEPGAESDHAPEPKPKSKSTAKKKTRRKSKKGKK